MSRLFFMATAAMLTLAAQPATAKQFQGFNVGAGVGYTRLSVDQPIAGSAQRLNKDQESSGYRLFAGYDQRLGDAFVLGGELGVNFGGEDVKQTIGGVNYTAEVQSQSDLTLRAGYVVGEKLLLYGRLGGGRISEYAARSGAAARKVKKDESGVVYGVGAEYAFGDNWGVRGEYTRFDGSKDLTRDQLLASAVYHF
jgi:opacity protein-like surface antigen